MNEVKNSESEHESSDPGTYLLDGNGEVMAATYDSGNWPHSIALEIGGVDFDRESIDFLIDHLQQLKKCLKTPKASTPQVNDPASAEDFWVIDLPNVKRMKRHNSSSPIDPRIQKSQEPSKIVLYDH